MTSPNANLLMRCAVQGGPRQAQAGYRPPVTFDAGAAKAAGMTLVP